MRAFACVLAVVFLFALGSCKLNLKPPADTGPINAYCAMHLDEAVDASCYVHHQDKKVGFCCNKCKQKFESLSDAEKDNRVAELPKK